MKKIIILFVIILISFPIIAEDKLHLRIGTYENAPKIFTDGNGNISGFWADISNYIAVKEGWKLEWIHGDWDQCLERLENNEIDILVDVGITPNRQKRFLFSNETVLMSWSRLYTQQGANLESLLELDGKKIAGLKGSFNIEEPEGLKDIINNFGLNCEIVELSDYHKVFEALEKGEVFAGITNKDFGAFNEIKYNIERTPIIFQPARIQFAFPVNSELAPKLIEIIDSNLIQLKEDNKSIYYTSMERYLGGVEKIDFFPLWVKILIVFILGLAVIFFVLSRFLKYQVNQKTMLLKQDITERKKVEEELQKNEALLNSTQQLTKVGGWKWNIENQTMFWTDETYRIHEIDSNEIKTGSTKHIEDGIKCYDEKDQLVIMEAFQKCASEGISYDMEFPFTTVKGNKIWIRTTAEAEKENGEIVGVVGNIMDITNRKQVEIELEKHQNNLENLVKEQTDKLEERTQKLEKSQQSLVFLLEDMNETKMELEKKNKELKQFNKLFVDREFRIKELRDKVKELEGNVL